MVIRELVTKIGYMIDTAGLQKLNKQLDEVKKRARDVAAAMELASEAVKNNKALGRMQKAGQEMMKFVTLPLGVAAGYAVNEASKAAIAFELIKQGLITSGRAAGKNAEEVTAMAEGYRQLTNELQNKTLYENDAILRQVSGTLLAFGNISEEVFPRVQALVLDAAAKFDRDIGTMAMALGRTLEIPSEGLQGLRSAGVKLNDEQEKMLKRMTDAGKVAEAQKYILDLVAEAAGGTAEKIAEQSSGTKQLMNAMSDLAEEFGMIMLPVVRRFTKFLRGLTEWMGKLSTTAKKTIIIIGALAFVLAPLLLVITAVSKAFIFWNIAAGLLNVTLLGVIGRIAAIAAPILLAIAAIAIVYLYIEDLVYALGGGQSMIGSFFSELWSWATYFYDIIKNKVLWAIDEAKKKIGEFASMISNLPGIKQLLDFFGAQKETFSFAPQGNAFNEQVFNPAAFAGGAANSSAVNVNSQITVAVPEGTPQQQADYVRKAAQDAVEESWNGAVRHLAVTSQGQ